MDGAPIIVAAVVAKVRTGCLSFLLPPKSHMRVSIPTIPQFLLERVPSRPPISAAAAIERVADFIRPGNVTVLTGAGVSVDSGIRAYRGKDGRYMNPNYKCAQVTSRVGCILLIQWLDI